MKSKNIIIKIILDIIMLVLMLLEFSVQFTGNTIHEIIGITLTVLFIIHHLLNYKWYASIFKGKYNLNRIIMLIVNFMLLISMILVISSSITISRTVFTFLSINGDIEIRRIHTASAYWSLILMAIHLGTHFNMIKGLIKKKVTSKIIKLCIYIIEIIIILYGINIFFKFNIWSKLIGYYTFTMWEEGTIISSFFKNSIFLFTISILTHNILKLLRRI